MDQPAFELQSKADAADLRQFTARMQRVDSGAALRLTGVGDVLVVSGAPLYPKGLGDELPLVIAMRALRLRSGSADGIDAVVPASGLTDRFARMERTGGLDLGVPPAEVRMPWAAVTPPRAGWREVAQLSVEKLREAAAWGIAAVAEASPSGAGALAVDKVRRTVWSRPLPDCEIAPLGAAFGMDAAGFDVGETATVYRTGAWLRFATPAGFIITRSTEVC
ncbi:MULTISPECIES: hypothetical protein [unclassified Brevibacterium]|uniref:hypothetical protein n=1 Tax=unclassified Brevibacterium TaxID=2614124 RepID=UPI0008C68FB1|nr:MULTISPECIES: hypothetical protein [unclassified Brevibacterium]OFL65177.1 hypothetical protein HMPREF2757_04670 [Brevibacterium sp. HMSC063G07]